MYTARCNLLNEKRQKKIPFSQQKNGAERYDIYIRSCKKNKQTNKKQI